MPASENDPCEVCGNPSGNRLVHAREMMFGHRDEFRYTECGHCGCLRLIDVPTDWSRYYPAEYYPATASESSSGLKSWLGRKRAEYSLRREGIVGKLLVWRYGEPRCQIFGGPKYYDWLRACRVDFTTKIADVGCGSAILLRRMRADGFTDLTGIDPFAPETVRSEPGLRIQRTDVFGVRERFGLIMLHHTFEHLGNPLGVLRHLHSLLEPGGHLLIRIPVASSHAYRHYGRDWAQLDAPRHLFLHTEKSMSRLAQDAGLELTSVVHDSTEFQFWASEQYRRDIPLKSPESYAVNRATALFSPATIEEFRQRAEELNARAEGDSACFYLRKS